MKEENVAARILAERVLEREPEGSTAWILAENTLDLLAQIERLKAECSKDLRINWLGSLE